MIIDIKGIEHEVSKRYVCLSLKHGTIESDFSDMRDSTSCKITLKWTTELPTKEGYYWFKFNNESKAELITVVKFNDKFYEDIGSLITLSEGEYCGPLEPPKHS